MRFLVREQSYETPIASGRLRYSLADVPTGVLENWRLTNAIDGYRILRIDVDGRNSLSGDSYLYHLLMDPAGQPERLTYRFWGGTGHKVEGNLFFEADQIICSRTINGERAKDMALVRPEPLLWWFPAAASMSTFGQLSSAEYSGMYLDENADLVLQALPVKVELGPIEELKVMNRVVQTQIRTVCWADQKRTIWFDDHNWPIKMQNDQLAAAEIRYVRR